MPTWTNSAEKSADISPSINAYQGEAAEENFELISDIISGKLEGERVEKLEIIVLLEDPGSEWGKMPGTMTFARMLYWMRME